MTAFALFFAGTAAIGIPAVILCWLLDRRNRRLKAAAGIG
jgi:PAT family beta-lactamase induction signal transducer AmpG